MSSWETRDNSKAGELILLVAQQTAEDETAGATKLNKILYFAELSHMRRTGKADHWVRVSEANSRTHPSNDASDHP